MGTINFVEELFRSEWGINKRICLFLTELTLQKAKVVRLEQIRLLGKIGRIKMRKMKDSGIK
jgi:hypothetical protein